MAASDDEIEKRVDKLEREMVRLREQVGIAATDAGAARVLASGADRDVSEVRSELRSHTRVLTALRETQHEMQVSQHEMQVTMQEMDHRMTTGFATVHTGMSEIAGLLRTLTDPPRD